MAEEATGTGREPAGPSAEDKLKAVEAERQRLLDRNRQLEAAVVNPEYLTYLEAKAKRDAGEREKSEAISEDEFNSMTPAQQRRVLVKEMEDIATKVVKTYHGQIVAPRQDEQEARAAAQEIDQAAAVFEDFYDYKEQMVALSRRYPNAGAVDLYGMAVTRAGKAPKLRGRSGGETDKKETAEAKGKPAAGETGGVAPGARHRAITKGEGSTFDRAFDEAWKESMGAAKG